jgi:MGT family glycosyltransferase
VAITDLLDDADGVIVTTVPELDQPAGAVPANVRYIGPLIEDAGPDAGWRPAVSGVPLVVVSLGTTPMGEAPVVQRVLDALADEPVQAVATIGDHLDAGTFTVPSNATIVPYVRHAALFPHARVVVSHAGLGTVSAALIHGVPLVCIPLGRDQPANAAHVEAAGAGYTVASTASTDELTSTIMAATADAPVTAAAREMGDVMARYENGGRAVLEVEQLLTRLAE